MENAKKKSGTAISGGRHIHLPLLVGDIENIIPHRAPFLMLDRVIEFQDAVYVVGEKLVSSNEPYFQGHFPGRPIMPGVLMLEALAQLGALFARLSTGGSVESGLIVFTGAEEVRFRRMVIPGDKLTLRMELGRRKFGHWKMNGRATVGDEMAMEATLMAAEVK